MDIYRSINKRVRKTHHRITERYLRKLQHGKAFTYYYHVSFYLLYLKRLWWLFLSLLTFKKSTYKNLYKAVVKNRSIGRYHPPIYYKNFLKGIFQQLFGLHPFSVSNLYPARTPQYILKTTKLSFVLPTHPLISIIIPVYNQLSYTYNCLLSLKDRVSRNISYEIIVIDNGSNDETENFFQNNVKGVKYIRNEENLGCIRRNTIMSGHAKGTYICLINNDTEIQYGWIEFMLDVIKRDNTIGAVGSKLLYPNNVLQEAGGIIFNDANRVAFGNLDSAKKDIYNFIREVDYCSGSLLFRKEDFINLGKFECKYTSPDYGNIDLCFNIRHILNKRIVYQPLSILISYQANLHSVKRKDVDRTTFIQKWKIALEEYYPFEHYKSYRRLLPKSSILILAEYLPKAETESGLRLIRLISVFRSFGLHVIILPQDIPKNNEKDDLENLVNRGVEIRIGLNSFSSAFDLETADFIKTVKYVWFANTDIARLYQDKMFLFGEARRIFDEANADFFLRPTTNTKLLQEEDLIITVKESGKQEFRKLTTGSIYHLPAIYIPISENFHRAFSERSGLLFEADFRYVADVDAAIWLIRDIMPLIHKSIPHLHLTIIGDSLNTAMIKDIKNDNNKYVSFFENLRDTSQFYLENKVFVSPIRYESGKGRISRAIEYRIPIVTTTTMKNILGPKNIMTNMLLFGDTENAIAENVIQLYSNENIWKQYAIDRRKEFRSQSPQSVAEDLKYLFDHKLIPHE